MDVCARHGIADHPEEEGGGLVAYQIGVEIERSFRILVRWRRKPGWHAIEQQGQAADGSRNGSLAQAGQGRSIA